MGARYVAPGDRITDKKALVRIDAIDRLQLSFAISEQGVAFARTGVKLEVRVRPYPDEIFPGEVFFVSPSLDPATRRMILKAWVPNTDHRLRPGLFANVDLEIAQRENALLVPESAVVFDREGTYVWRLRDEVAERVPIEIGLRKSGRVEVTLGLAPGDTIVTAGTHKVVEGRKLRAAELVTERRRRRRVRAPPRPAGPALEDRRDLHRAARARDGDVARDRAVRRDQPAAPHQSRAARDRSARSSRSRRSSRAPRRRSSRRRSPTSSRTR